MDAMYVRARRPIGPINIYFFYFQANYSSPSHLLFLKLISSLVALSTGSTYERFILLQ